MPEGDTIHRTASALRTALVGRATTYFEAPRLSGPAPQVGRLIESVSSRGKHLLIRWDDDLVLHTHLKMTGSWHLYRPGEPWRKAHRNVRVTIGTEDWLAVCFNAPIVETYRTPDRRRHPAIGHLGPDLCDEYADLGEAVRRLIDYPQPEAYLSEVLLDQRVFCGVGNVYRSEILWALQLSPWAMVCDLDQRDAILLVDTAATMLRSNLRHARRVTAADVPGGLAVYGRSGQGCPRCHDTIQMHRIGQFARSLYWCEGCQTQLDSRPVVDLPVDDPHPAAAQFLASVRTNRRTG